MSRFHRFIAGFKTARSHTDNVYSISARERFRRSMPGELGICAAARLYGLGR